MSHVVTPNKDYNYSSHGRLWAALESSLTARYAVGQSQRPLEVSLTAGL